MEAQVVEAKTLAFMKGPFNLISYEPVMRDSSYEGRPPYEVGMHLTLGGPTGREYSCTLPKGGKDPSAGLLYHRFAAMMNDNPDINVLNFTYDPQKGGIIVSGKVGTVGS